MNEKSILLGIFPGAGPAGPGAGGGGGQGEGERGDVGGVRRLHQVD